MLLKRGKSNTCSEFVGSKIEEVNTIKKLLIPSTMQPLMGVTKNDEKKKPAIYKFFDYAKGGSDIVDQRMRFYTCETKS